MSKYEYRLDPDRPNNTAAAIYQAARRGGKTVLDIGSGPGIIGSFLAKNDGKDVTCIDNDAEALESAAREGATHTFQVDLREADWYAQVAGHAYDVVILADVLEHLTDPDRLLRDIRREGLVADDGRLVVSVPNACHESVIVELATGHFNYTETGLLDRTHLRFFSLDSMTDLLESCGFMVAETHRTTMGFEATRQGRRAHEVSPQLRAAIDELGLEGRTFQYILTVHPAAEAAVITGLRERLSQAELEAAQARAEIDKLRAQEERCRGELAQQRSGHDSARDEVDRLKRKLAEVYGSATWRAGSMLRRLGRPVTATARFIRR